MKPACRPTSKSERAGTRAWPPSSDQRRRKESKPSWSKGSRSPETRKIDSDSTWDSCNPDAERQVTQRTGCLGLRRSAHLARASGLDQFLQTLPSGVAQAPRPRTHLRMTRQDGLLTAARPRLHSDCIPAHVIHLQSRI